MKYLRSKNGYDLFHSYSPKIENSNKIIIRNNNQNNGENNYQKTRIKNYQFPLSTQTTEGAHIFQNTNSLYNLMKQFSNENFKINRLNIHKTKIFKNRIRKKDSNNSFNREPINYIKRHIILKRESMLEKRKNDGLDEGEYHSIFNNLIIKNKMKSSFNQYISSKSIDLSSKLNMNLGIDKCVKSLRKDKNLFNSEQAKVSSSNNEVLNYKIDYVFNINKNIGKHTKLQSLLLNNAGLNPFGYRKSLTLPLNHHKIILDNDYNNQINIVKKNK